MATPNIAILLVFQAKPTSRANPTTHPSTSLLHVTFPARLLKVSVQLVLLKVARVLISSTKFTNMGSFQMPVNHSSSELPESSCSYLLQELKLIWDEVGQDQVERDRILLELEQECVQVYRRKVDSANIYRIRIHRALAEAEAEFTNLLLSLGERSFQGRPEKVTGTLKEQLELITPALQEMQMRKEERVNQFQDVQRQIQNITSEVAGHSDYGNIKVNENGLSLKKLEEFQNELQRLHNEKSNRLQKVKEYIKSVHDLAATMGMDSSEIINDIDPSLNGSDGQKTGNMSDAILNRLNDTVELLKDEKKKRTEKLYRLGKTLTTLWNLMDTTYEDQQPFAHLTKFVSSHLAYEISSPRSITLDIIHQVESEVERLDQLKTSKMKELFQRKRIELEEVCKKSHMEIPSQMEMDNIQNLITSGQIDHEDLLNSMEEHIWKAKEEACSRKGIMEKVEKWMISCNEECWLAEYSQDENRYSVSRGAHKNLKRVERARTTVNKIPALVELLMAKTKVWEDERNKVFLYDEVPLLAMLEEYTLLMKEKEEDKYKQRERKRIQGQVLAQQENLYGSRPNTSSGRPSSRNLNRSFCTYSPLNKKLSSMTQQLGSNTYTAQGTNVNRGKKTKMQMYSGRQGYASHIRAETASVISSTLSGPSSP